MVWWVHSYSGVQCSHVRIIPAADRDNLGTQTLVHTKGHSTFCPHSLALFCFNCGEVCKQVVVVGGVEMFEHCTEYKADLKGVGLTCREVDVGKKNDVCGDEGDEFSNADLLLEVDVNHVVISEGAVGGWVKLLQAGP